MDVTKAAIGELALMPIIIGLVQAIKRFWPEGTSAVWFGLSFLLGVVGEVVVFLIAHPAPLENWDLATWALCVVAGLSFGLAAGKAYDVAKDGI